MRVEIKEPRELAASDVERLYRLFRTAFGADRRGFEEDLSEKDRVLSVFDDQGLQAFSTLRTYRPESGVRVLFSGDTFASPRARLGARLPALWAEYVFRRMSSEEGVKDYWLLLCSGYRTFRILPTFFRRYAPGADTELLTLRDRWGREIFAQNYRDGVVRPRWPTPLHDPEPPERLRRTSAVVTFLEANPGYREGDELVCLAPLECDNLTAAGRRLALAEPVGS